MKDVNVPYIVFELVEVYVFIVFVCDELEAEQSLITVEGGKASMEVPLGRAGWGERVRARGEHTVGAGSVKMGGGGGG
ncbi:biotin/lipoyl-containing protein, partial [Salmonella enterica subsp. enterica serovar Infantis]